MPRLTPSGENAAARAKNSTGNVVVTVRSHPIVWHRAPSSLALKMLLRASEGTMTATILFLLPALALSAAATQPQPVAANERAPIAFTAAVARYVELHRLLEPHLAGFTADPEQIARARLRHRDSIRLARATGRHGDVFTPLVSAYFRRQIETAARALPIGEVEFPFEVLPELPEELQYLLQGRDLVILDIETDLVVDVLDDALPPGAYEQEEPSGSELCAPEPFPVIHPSPCDVHGELDMCWS
jgi:hypothetical protein